MNVIVLQHIKIEDPGFIKDLMIQDGAKLTTIELNEGIIFYSEQITTRSETLETLIKLKELGVDSNRILLITAICSNKGLNEIAKLFPNQVIYTSCIDEEDENTKFLVPGIGNPLLRLSTIFQDKN